MRYDTVLILLIGLLLTVQTVAQQSSPEAPVRVYVEGTHGHKFVAGVDHAIPVPDAAMHNQQMELAKTFLQRCPDVLPTVNKEKADYIVTLNWAPQTRIFLGGKLIHKPDQIMVTNRDGDVLYSNVARSVGGDVDAVCRLINRRKVGGPVDSSAAQVTGGTNQSTKISSESMKSLAYVVEEPSTIRTRRQQLVRKQRDSRHIGQKKMAGPG